MALYYVAFLAVVQGITEFLPISSSAHLILGRDLVAALGLPVSEGSAADQLAFDIALHVGTLGAVLLYFRRDVAEMVLGALDGLSGRGGDRFRLTLMVVIATLPILAVGFLARNLVADLLRATEIIAWTTLLFGIALWAADRREIVKYTPADITVRDALVVGALQCVAIIPGVSRAGICMTAGRLVGLDRPLSARFAMLLAMPTIAAAGLLAGYGIYRGGDARLTVDALVGAALAFLFALAAIELLMRWLRHATYMPFVIYRIALGLLLLALIYGFGWTPAA